MEARDGRSQALLLVRWLVEGSDVTPQSVLLQKPASPNAIADQPAIHIRSQTAYLLRIAGGWTYQEIADVFEAFTGHTAARAAVRRAVVDEGRVVEARRMLFGGTCDE